VHTTAPFVLTAWLLLFAVYQFEFIRPSELIAPLAPNPEAAVQTELRELATGTGGLTVANLAHGFFRGVGEVMFQDNLLTGVIFLVAILVNSRISAAFAAVGSAVALLTALALGGDGFSVYHGLYGFNAVLCAIALGGLFFVLTWKSAIYALLAAMFSVPAFAAIAVLLSPIGMPALTAPSCSPPGCSCGLRQASRRSSRSRSPTSPPPRTSEQAIGSVQQVPAPLPSPARRPERTQPSWKSERGSKLLSSVDFPLEAGHLP
jgi:hypothetical protein